MSEKCVHKTKNCDMSLCEGAERVDPNFGGRDGSQNNPHKMINRIKKKNDYFF